MDGTIFSYGVFSFPNFSAIAAKFGKGPFLLAANLNPIGPVWLPCWLPAALCTTWVSSISRAAGDINDKEVLDKVIQFARCAHVVNSPEGFYLRPDRRQKPGHVQRHGKHAGLAG